MTAGACSTCGGPRDRGEHQRLCLSCHAHYQSQWRRARTRLYRAAMRAVARLAAREGRVVVQPCAVCGSIDSQIHHPDHELPLFTIWLCRRHHMLWHEHWKSTVLNSFIEWLEVARACAAVRAAEDAASASAAPSRSEAA